MSQHWAAGVGPGGLVMRPAAVGVNLLLLALMMPCVAVRPATVGLDPLLLALAAPQQGTSRQAKVLQMTDMLALPKRSSYMRLLIVGSMSSHSTTLMTKASRV